MTTEINIENVQLSVHAKIHVAKEAQSAQTKISKINMQ